MTPKGEAKFLEYMKELVNQAKYTNALLKSMNTAINKNQDVNSAPSNTEEEHQSSENSSYGPWYDSIGKQASAALNAVANLNL